MHAADIGTTLDIVALKQHLKQLHRDYRVSASLSERRELIRREINKVMDRIDQLKAGFRV